MFFFFQAEDGIRDLVRSRGLGDVYKRQGARGTVTRVGERRTARLDQTGVERFEVDQPEEHLSLIHI